MSVRAQRALLLGVSLGALSLGDAANAQTELPAVTVTAPSPIVRRAPPAPRRVTATAPAAPAAPLAPAEQAAPSLAPLPLGALPIVTDQFATVTVVPNEE